MRWIDNTVRFLVGGLFVFSGLVKLNDPMGTEIKMKEYFEVFAEDFGHFFEVFVPYALPIAFFMIVLEVILGVAILIKYRMKITLGLTTALIVFFTFLTFYSAYFNKVTDCGCFGDAIPLTPWQSFSKDVVLALLVGYLLIRIRQFKPIFNGIVNNIVLGALLVLSIYAGVHALNHLPFIDFRPYAVHDNIAANMIAPEKPKFVYSFEKEGQEIESTTYLSADDGYTYLGHRITNQEKTIPKITDYNIWNEEVGDFTSQSLSGDKLFIIIYEAKQANLSKIDKLSALVHALENELDVIAITSSSGEDFKSFLISYNMNIPFFYGDATVLKAMIRSSPGIMIVSDGTVLGKWHYNDIPTAEKIHFLLKK